MLLELGKVYLFNYLHIYLLAIFFYVFVVQQSFGTVEKGWWNNLPIVLKKLNETYSEGMTNVFLKEDKLLNDVGHENIIDLLVCDNPAAIMLELCEFSMKPFHGDKSFHSLDKFLKYLAKNELSDFFPGICKLQMIYCSPFFIFTWKILFIEILNKQIF